MRNCCHDWILVRNHERHELREINRRERRDHKEYQVCNRISYLSAVFVLFAVKYLRNLRCAADVPPADENLCDLCVVAASTAVKKHDKSQNQKFRTNSKPPCFPTVPTVPVQKINAGNSTRHNNMNNNDFPLVVPRSGTKPVKKNSRLMMGQLPNDNSYLTNKLTLYNATSKQSRAMVGRRCSAA